VRVDPVATDPVATATEAMEGRVDSATKKGKTGFFRLEKAPKINFAKKNPDYIHSTFLTSLAMKKVFNHNCLAKKKFFFRNYSQPLLTISLIILIALYFPSAGGVFFSEFRDGNLYCIFIIK